MVCFFSLLCLVSDQHERICVSLTDLDNRVLRSMGPSMKCVEYSCFSPGLTLEIQWPLKRTALHLMKEDGPDSGLKEAHNVFVQAAIRYIRFEESCKAVQLDLSDVCLPSESTSGSSIQPLDITAETVRMMGKRPNPPTVDALVTHVSGKPPLPEPPRRRKIHRSKPHKGQGHKAQAQGHKGQEHRKHKKSKPIVDVADPNQESARRSKNTEERRQSQKPENKKGAKKIQKS